VTGSDEHWKRDAARRAIVPGVLAVAGIVLLAVGHVFVGGALLALAGVLGMSLVFLEIGYGEDRERRREAAASEARAESGHPPRGPLRRRSPRRRP
jgi:hypothetical protein